MSSSLSNSFLLERAETSEHIVFAISNDATFFSFNKAWLRYRGSSLKEELEKGAEHFLHQEDTDFFFTGVSTFCQNNEPCQIECRLRDSSGNFSWFGFLLSPIFSSDGNFSGGIAYGHDITEKKRIEEDARRFLAVTSTADAGIIIKDKEGRITDWNAGCQAIMGYTAAEMIGKTSDAYTYQPNLQAIAAINRRVSTGETVSFTKTKVNHKDGRLIICVTTFSPIINDSGAVTGSIVLFHDVTAEKLAEQSRLKAEANLQKSRHDLGAVLTAAPAPIFLVDLNTMTILSSNPAFARMCGASEESLLGQPITAFLENLEETDAQNGSTPTFLTSAHAMLKRLRNNQQILCRLTRRDGSIAEVAVMGKPLSFRERSAFAAHCIDLTEQRQHAQALRDAVQAAEEASRMKSAFLANMSHEIRTPLNGVIGFAELALDEPRISDAVKNYLDKIKLSANGLLEIINDVLDISKIEAGKIDLETTPFSLHDDILTVCETIIAPKAEEKGITLYLYTEPLVSRKFMGDQTRLRQILLNLLSNAIKFTNVGIVKLMSSVEELNADSATIYFEVKDSGIGMASEQLQKIFDPFTQADSSTTRKYGGTGLGLTITKNLIELMGGTLRVESAVGIGSKFSFSLTFQTIADNSPKTLLDMSPAKERIKPLFRGTVLVCEDNVINQQVIREHLLKVGLEPVIVANGKLGVDLVRNHLRGGQLFDLILMDIHMPVMDGLEATEKLLAMNIPTPIIALTANAMSTDRKKYLTHGMADYLAKPFRAHELWDCLLRHLKAIGSVLPSPNGACASVPTPPPDASASSVIDRTLGFENAVGNAVLYKRLQVNFLHDNKEAFTTFKNAFNTGNLTLAHRMAHTLKSASATLGAMELSAISGDIEAALNDGRIEIVRECLPNFAAMLEAVLNELAAEETEAAHNNQTAHLDKKKALEVLDRLEPLLHNGDSESLDYLDALASVLCPIGEISRSLAAQISDYDFDLAAATLREIRTIMEMNHDQ